MKNIAFHDFPSHYAITNTPLEFLLIAATESTILFVEFGNCEIMLEAYFLARFPKATSIFPPQVLQNCIAQFHRYFERPQSITAVHCSSIGSEFQQIVWRALQTIPVGQTRTYAQIATQIGKPAATRAVAQACATNPVAIAIPCHRVIGSDGKLRGYRWGIARKAALLQYENPNSVK